MVISPKQKLAVGIQSVSSSRVVLDDWALTTVHVARYPIHQTTTQLVLFDKETCLLEWCQKNNVTNAMSGGFFLRNQHQPLGDLWIRGKKQQSVPFSTPYDNQRGGMYVTQENKLVIAPRYLLPQVPKTDLLQAGPLLIQNSRSTTQATDDPEGFSAASFQFDTDITTGRYPRAAIGTDDQYIYSIVCDGYGQGEAGLTLSEFSQILLQLGITDALNLDGGSSASLIFGTKLRNRSLQDLPEATLHPKGRPIFSAILFK